jgi:hypothetical protein
MYRSGFNVEGQLSYDPDVFRMEFDDETDEYVLVNLYSGEKFTPTIALHKVDALVGEPDIFPLDAKGVEVTDLFTSEFAPLDEG